MNSKNSLMLFVQIGIPGKPWTPISLSLLMKLDSARYWMENNYQYYTISRRLWCIIPNDPRFLYISFTLSNLIYKELHLPSLIDYEWDVLLFIFLNSHFEIKPPSCWSPLISQQWKMNWGILTDAFCQIQSCLPLLRCKDALNK